MEEVCRGYFAALRWPDGITCPRCESGRVFEIASRRQWGCRLCRYQFSVRSVTVLHDSHLPLWKWLVAVYLTVTARRGLTAHELHAVLGGSYKSWWYAAHRLRSALGVRGPEHDLPSALFEAIGEAVEPRPTPNGSIGSDRPFRSTGRKYRGYYSREMRWRSAATESHGTCADVARALVTSTPLPLDDLVRGVQPAAQAV